MTGPEDESELYAAEDMRPWAGVRLIREFVCARADERQADEAKIVREMARRFKVAAIAERDEAFSRKLDIILRHPPGTPFEAEILRQYQAGKLE